MSNKILRWPWIFIGSLILSALITICVLYLIRDVPISFNELTILAFFLLVSLGLFIGLVLIRILVDWRAKLRDAAK